MEIALLTGTEKKQNKWRLIPHDWKKDVDSSLLSLLSSNRKLISNLESQIKEMSAASPIKFLRGLDHSWHNHNLFFSSLGYFLRSFPDNGALSTEQSKETQKILNDMPLVDTITLLHSAAIKPILERNSNGYITPFSSFYIDYPLDHYNLLDGNLSLEEIIGKYHGDSPELFEQRKSKGILFSIFSGKSNSQEREFLKKIKQKMFLEALYEFYIDRPEVMKALVNISTMDNFDEYKFLYNLAGIEGFYLKSYLTKHCLLIESQQRTESLLSYFTPLNLMESEKTQPSTQLRDVPFYAQSSGVSCASACAMMVPHLFYKEPISKELEDNFYSLMKSNFLDGCPFSKISSILSDLYPELNIEIAHNTPTLFDEKAVKILFGNGGIKAIEEYREHSKIAELKGVKVSISKNLMDEVERTISRGGVYMAATHLGGGILHSELVVGKKKDELYVYDPINGCAYFSSISDFKRKMSTPIGEWGISFSNKLPTTSSNYKSSINWFQQKEEELRREGIKLAINERRVK